MGAPVDTSEIVSKHENAFEVWVINMAVFNAFWKCRTQWNMAPTKAGIVWGGLKYEAVLPVLSMIGAGPEVFADVQVMETAALEILNMRSDR